MPRVRSAVGSGVTALELACQAIQGPGWHVLRDPEGSWFVKACDPRKIGKAIELHGPADVTVSAVPRLELGNFRLTGDSPVLWVRAETRDSCKRLARFTPEPTLVLREGDTVRQVALWSLTRPCPAGKLEEANGRLSYNLRTKMRHGNPGFVFHPPGTVIRLKRREIEVVAAGGSGEPVPAGRLLGRLRSRPDPPDWRQAA